MKRYIFLVAAVALATVSCSKTYDTTTAPGRAIGFGTWTENLTRARTQGSSTFASGDDFAVYGYKDKTTPAPATVFDDVVVSTTNGTTWTYTTPRYWDSNYDSYTFFAISPAAIGTAGTVYPQTGVITSGTITFAGNDNDILVADKKVVEKGSAPYFSNYATVPLVFNHVASLVDFKIKKASGLHDATVTLSAFELSNIDNAGVLSVSDAYTDTHPVVSWSTDTRSTYGPANGVTPVTVSSGSPLTVVEDTAFPGTPAASTMVINNLVVKPQTFRASNGSNPQKITFTYKIAVTGSADVEYADCVLYLCDFDNVDDEDQGGDAPIASWEPGKHYTFYITIDAHAINFSATITDWKLANGYNYLVN